MVVNSTLVKDDRRVLAIKELSGLLKDKNYNFDQECIDNFVKRFNQNVYLGSKSNPCANVTFRNHYIWYSFKNRMFYVFEEDYFGCGFHKSDFLSLDVLMIGMLDINEKRKNRGFIDLYKNDGFSLFIRDEILVRDYIKKLLSTFIQKQLKSLSQKLLLESSTFHSEVDKEKTLVPLKCIYDKSHINKYLYLTPLLLMTREERESVYYLLIKLNINRLQFGDKFHFSYEEDKFYTSSFRNEVDNFFEKIRFEMIESFIDKGSSDVENPPLLKTTKEFIFKTYEELFLDCRVLKYSEKHSEFKFKKDIKEHYLSKQLMFSKFLYEISLNNFSKNKGTLLYTLLRFLSENFDDSNMNILVSKVLADKANEMTSEMDSLREKLKEFITEHFIELFWGDLIQSNEDYFLNEVFLLDECRSKLQFFHSQDIEVYKMIKIIFSTKLTSHFTPLKCSDVIEFIFSSTNRLSMNRCDGWDICFAVKMGQNINFEHKNQVSLCMNTFTSILFETSDFNLRKNKEYLKVFAALTKNNFEDIDVIFLDEENEENYQKEFEFFRFGVETGALSGFPNAKYLSDFIVKMADHLKK